ncbi:hypothetical protein FIBSPDRAFT_1038162 [Athelia psychrophila]|uniref:Uncharacterized protein n=1 Tax=Athelia psychrophila TaxID=1759441 RepID=A0A166TD89_9AGAM|nr:hypothetical protein FIBSPDRAFT_1038162 [Fibularhizoctonia sp. CBS 109695]
MSSSHSIQYPAPTSAADTGTATTTMQGESTTGPGKAFKALKDIPLRRKLASYLSMFPHEDQPNVNTSNVAEMYSDLLRSIKPGAHSEPVVRLAMKILVTQICSGRTSYLLNLLMAKLQSEMRQIISTICSFCMKDLEDLSDSLERKTRTHTVPASTKQVVAITWALIFAAKMATRSTQIIVIDAGVLDVILRVYIRYPTLGVTTAHDSECKAELFDSCQYLLRVLVASTPAVFDHPVCSLWTDCNAQPPAYGEEPRIDPIRFRAAWRRVPRACAKQRLMIIFRGSLWGSGFDSASGIEAYCDLVEFTRAENYDAETVALATLAILRRIISSSDHARSLINLLAQGSLEDVRRVFSGIVQLWLESIADKIQKDETLASGRQMRTVETHSQMQSQTGSVPDIPTEPTLLEQEKESFFYKVHGHDSVLVSIIEFARECATSMDSGTRQAMLEGGAHALVLSAFVCNDYQLDSLIEPFRKATLSRKKGSRGNTIIPAPPSLASINADASTLSVSIHTPKFQRNWQGGRFEHRLNVCGALVTSLFPAAEDMGEEYAVTRALLFRIVVYD